MSSDPWGSSPWGREQMEPQVPAQYTPPPEYALPTPQPLVPLVPPVQQQGAEAPYGGQPQQQGQVQAPQAQNQLQPQPAMPVYGQTQPQAQLPPQQPLPQPQAVYGQPQQQPQPLNQQPPQFGAGEYGEPQPPNQQPQDPDQSRRLNGLALGGALTCFVPILGLVLSILGLARAKGIGAGRSVARTGLVLSLVFTLAWGGVGYYAYRVAESNAGDPGCVSANADYVQYNAQLDQDAAAMTKGGVGSVAFAFGVKKYQSDLEVLIRAFNTDAAKAGPADVRAAIQGVGTDLTQLDAQLGNLATGDYAGATHVMDLDSQLMTDFQHLESLCRSASNG